MAGSYSSLKYLQADDLDPMNFIAFGDSLAFYWTESIIDLLNFLYTEGASTISQLISPPKSVINPKWIAAWQIFDSKEYN